MIHRINKNLTHELNVLEEGDSGEIVDHFANKVLKVAWEVSQFGSGEELMKFEDIYSKFYKLNLSQSRYQSILDKLENESNSKKLPKKSFKEMEEQS